MCDSREAAGYGAERKPLACHSFTSARERKRDSTTPCSRCTVALSTTLQGENSTVINSCTASCRRAVNVSSLAAAARALRRLRETTYLKETGLSGGQGVALGGGIPRGGEIASARNPGARLGAWCCGRNIILAGPRFCPSCGVLCSPRIGEHLGVGILFAHARV